MLSKIKQVARQVWWTAVIGGAISIIFGIIAIASPGRTLNAFIYLFSLFVIAISAASLAQSITDIKNNRLWWLSMLFAVCGISIAVYIMANPNVAKAFVAVILAIYIFVQSLLDLIVASYSDDAESKTPMIGIGIIGLLFGFLVLFRPVLASEAMVWVIGLYVLIHGVFTEYYAFRIRSRVGKVTRGIAEALNTPGNEAPENRNRTNRKSSRKHTAEIKEAKIVKKSAKRK